jgi:hypothetical protein
MIARHGAAIDRLRREMADEPCQDDLLEFLAYDMANFVYAFLLTTGNPVTVTDRTVRDDLKNAVLSTFAKHGISRENFCVWPDMSRPRWALTTRLRKASRGRLSYRQMGRSGGDQHDSLRRQVRPQTLQPTL